MNTRRRGMRGWILGGAAAILLGLAAQAAQTNQATPLRAKPFSDAEIVAQLAAGTSLQVLQRQGGWYEARAADKQGWLRMSSVQFASGESSSGLGDTLGFLTSGRAGATEATASTGVRGLDEALLAKAEPDMAAVARLDQFAVQETDARQFAAQAALKSASVNDLPQVKP